MAMDPSLCLNRLPTLIPGEVPLNGVLIGGHALLGCSIRKLGSQEAPQGRWAHLLPCHPLYCRLDAVRFLEPGRPDDQEFPQPPCQAPHHPSQPGHTQSQGLLYPGCQPRSPRTTGPCAVERAQFLEQQLWKQLPEFTSQQLYLPALSPGANGLASVSSPVKWE